MTADDLTVIALKVAKAGYYGGNPETVMKAKASLVLSVLEYEHFLVDYENAEYELNKATK